MMETRKSYINFSGVNKVFHTLLTIKKPLVSLMMPVHNREEYIREAIESVLQQTYPNWELNIVVDECTDGTLDIVKEYKKKTSE